MQRVTAILILAAAATTGAHAKSHPQQFSLRAKVLNIVIIPSPPMALPRDYIQVDFDARFAVTMRVVSISPSLPNLGPNRTVIFAIHSPSMLFATPNPQGKTYDFTLRPPENGRLWSLQTRRPNQSLEPTAGRCDAHI